EPCVEAAAAAGLHACVLPAALVPTLPSDWDQAELPCDSLLSLAEAWHLDGDELRHWTEAARQTLGVDLEPALLAYWSQVGNLDGVLLARKGGSPLTLTPAADIPGLE